MRDHGCLTTARESALNTPVPPRPTIAASALPDAGDPGTAPDGQPRPGGHRGLRMLREFAAPSTPGPVVEIVGRGACGDGAAPADWVTARLTSQVWRGTSWVHEFTVVIPRRPLAPGTMILWIDGGSSDQLPPAGARLAAEPSDVVWLADLATAAGMAAAVVNQIPFQPMFGQMVEDDLVAHSFAEFVRTGEPDWPLLLPMVKAAVAALDAAGGIAADLGHPVDRFVLGGASKRGWTSWLTAAADDRVVGIVPSGIDMLRLDRHVPLQLDSFGGRMSEMLDDYTSRGIEQMLLAPRGRTLLDVVDPWSHRQVISQPKIIALGTNDPYWPLGSLELYREGLVGPCAVSYCANAGHGLPWGRLAGLLAAMGRHDAGISPLPTLQWSFTAATDRVDAAAASPPTVARLDCDEVPARVLLWQAAAPGRDFRQARWQATAVEGDGRCFVAPLRVPHAGWAAAFLECRFERPPHPLHLTTSVHLQPAG